MIPHSFDCLLNRRRTLLLQGPMGPFFHRLAETLRVHGQEVWKVNFNAGDDWFFGGQRVIHFRDPQGRWPDRFKALIAELSIDAVVLFGQFRPMHQDSIREARALGVPVFVFEEGYFRPDYITLEIGGVNAASSLPREADFYRQLTPENLGAPRSTGQGFKEAAMSAIGYVLACAIGRARYHHYEHHRSMSPWGEGFRWLRGAWRRQWYGLVERNMLAYLSAAAQHKRFFLVPLQVANDSQIKQHSRFENVGSFIREVLDSFAGHAPIDRLLVLKHHPLDRPYNDYTALIRRESRLRGIEDRVHYIHDQHLPTLLKHAAGVVTVNSTTGLQALHHGTPVVALGDCLYAIDGLIYKESLDHFWSDPGVVDGVLYARFREHLMRQTQLNASFYAAAPGLPRTPSRAPQLSKPIALPE